MIGFEDAFCTFTSAWFYAYKIRPIRPRRFCAHTTQYYKILIQWDKKYLVEVKMQVGIIRPELNIYRPRPIAHSRSNTTKIYTNAWKKNIFLNSIL